MRTHVVVTALLALALACSSAHERDAAPTDVPAEATSDAGTDLASPPDLTLEAIADVPPVPDANPERLSEDDALQCADSCPPLVLDPFIRLTSLALGSGGVPGEGLDVDGDPTTCSPAPGCAGGVDNGTSALADVLGPLIASSFQQQTSAWLFNVAALRLDGAPFPVGFYRGSPLDAACVATLEVCDYLAEASSLQPFLTLDNVVAQGGTFRGGGRDYVFPLTLRLDSFALAFTLFGAQLAGTYATDPDGGVTTLDGVLGGMLNTQEILDIVNNLPDEAFAGMTLDKQQILTLIGTQLALDLDSNGDGVLDVVSLGLTFHAVAARVVGVTPE